MHDKQPSVLCLCFKSKPNNIGPTHLLTVLCILFYGPDNFFGNATSAGASNSLGIFKTNGTSSRRTNGEEKATNVRGRRR